jgi:hypothetical protein
MNDRTPTGSRLAGAFRDVGRRMGPRRLASGRWFEQAVGAWLAHERRVEPFLADPVARRVRAEALTRRACLRCAAAGATTAAATTAAEAVTTADLRTALVAMPLAGATVAAEMLYRTLEHARLMTDIADLNGVAIDEDRAEIVLRLFALAVRAAQHEETEDPGRALVDRVVHFERDVGGEAIGSRLLGESVLRNVVPFVGVVTSAAASWTLTARIGRLCHRYFAWRRLLDDAAGPVLARGPELRGLLVEGLWFVFTADGRLGTAETAVLSHLVRCAPDEARARVLARFVTDEADWLRRLRGIEDRSVRARLMHALNVAAAVDGAVPEPERRLLERAAASLRQPFSEADVTALADELAAA